MIHCATEIDHDRILTCEEGETIVVGDSTIRIIEIGNDEVLMSVDDSATLRVRPR